VTDAEWWATVKQPIAPRDAPARPRARLWTLRRGRHEAALDLRHVAAMGTELVLTVNGELRRSRLYRAAEAVGMAKAVSATRSGLQTRGWSDK
jgi:hypothetical protein